MRTPRLVRFHVIRRVACLTRKRRAANPVFQLFYATSKSARRNSGAGSRVNFEAGLSNRLQETLVCRAAHAVIGEKVEARLSRLDEHEPHLLAAFDAGHLGGGLKARTRGRRFGKVQ